MASHRFGVLLLALFLVFTGIVSIAKEISATDDVVIVHQSDLALPGYDTRNYRIVTNPNVSRAGGGEGRSIMKSTQGDKMEFHTMLYTGITNPQSMAVSPDGKTAWVMGTYKNRSDNARTGYIYKIDLTRFWGKAANGSEDRSAVTQGPEIVTGHGQMMSYNPKTETLWYIREMNVAHTTLVEVDPDTMEIKKEIHFKFNNRVDMQPTFCFDRDGNMWTYTSSAGTSWAPYGTVRIYKGTIDEDNHVNFEMMGQGLKYSGGRYCQSIDYNPANGRLYIIFDGVVYTVPTEKLEAGELTSDDVGTIVFDGSREFEGMTFDEVGCAYFVTNNPSEIMRDEISHEAAIKERARIEEALVQYDSHDKEITENTEAEKREIVKDEIGALLSNGI